jgi:UDP-2,3-diacylglucosamine pyrophosphatase LpxH
MINQNKIIIVPDVHGRTFWRSVLKNKDDTIVFLGDYCDPYLDEGITHKDCIRELTDILEFKKQNPERVVLLLGNHDISHMFPDYYTKCRWGTEETQMVLMIMRKNILLKMDTNLRYNGMQVMMTIQQL